MASTPAFLFVPVVVHRRQKDIDPATGISTGSAKTIKFMDWLFVKQSTALFLNIEPSFPGGGDRFYEFANAVANSKASAASYRVTAIDDFERKVFAGISDTQGKTASVWGREVIGRIGAANKSRISISIRTSVKSTSASGKNVIRTVSFAFPQYFSRLMIAQCASSLVAAKPELVANYFTVNNVRYPLYPKVYDGVLDGASTGAYLAKSIPSDLTDNEPNRPNDGGSPVAVNAENLAT